MSLGWKKNGVGISCSNFLYSFSLGPYWDPLICHLCWLYYLEFKLVLLWNSKAMLIFYRNMKKEYLNLERVCDGGQDRHKAAAHLAHIHSVLNNSQNHSGSLQKELFYFNIRNCSLFNNIPPPYLGSEMPLNLSESAGRNSNVAALWKDSLCLCFYSGKDRLDGVSHCINSISVVGWLEKACSFAGDFSSCCPGDNTAYFAHVWLGKLQCNQELQFLELEASSIIGNELQLALPGELELGGLPDLSSAPVASLNGFTMGLLNNCIFPYYLNPVTSEQTLGYKKMLSDVLYVTNSFYIVQLVMPVLAFALAGLWCEVAKIKVY